MRLLYKTGPMESLRKWFYKPKRDDRSLLAQFFFADDALNLVAAELDSFDGRKDPERCSALVNQLRHAQDRVLNITSQIMDQMLGEERVARGFRVKFPEDVLQDNLAGQLWFGAECLAAGSSIMHREAESAAMRPLARALTRSLETVRALLRERCLRALPHHHAEDILRESLKIFDRLFAEFELCYVSAMVPVKTPQEFEVQQLICVLFSETLHRALRMRLLTQEQVDDYDPALMFAIPRLAIITGLLIFSNGPLSIDKAPEEMSDMFRPFRTLLHKIRELLWTLERRELLALEQLLCTNEDIANVSNLELPSHGYGEQQGSEYPDIGEFVSRFYADHASCRELLAASSWADMPTTPAESTIIDTAFLPDNVEVFTPVLEGMRRLSEIPEKLSNDRTPDDSFNEECPTDNTFQEALDENKKRENGEPSSHRRASDSSAHRDGGEDQRLEDAGGGCVQLPDQSLVSSLNEQVTELTDKLSFIMTCTDCGENLHEQAQLHSFSTNDVSTLGTSKSSDHHFPTKEQPLTTVPSTSHGYLIPNAISQEPVVLASLSHNNSSVFDEDATNPIAHQIGAPAELGAGPAGSASIANANLSSLLLTDDEFRCSFLGSSGGADGVLGDVDGSTCEDGFRYAGARPGGKVSFVVGYESDGGDAASPVDSGICTENTSLDRSPDGDRMRDPPAHYMNQNRLISRGAPPDRSLVTSKETKNTLERTFSACDAHIGPEGTGRDVTVEITYVDHTKSESRNEAGSSMNVNNTIVCNSVLDNDVNIDLDNKVMREGEEDSSHAVSGDGDARGPRAPAKQRTGRKFSPKNKKKKSTRIWSPGRVILENRSNVEPVCPIKLNLDYFADDNGDGSCWSLSSATSSFHSECADDEEIALALQAQELAARHHTRAKFRSSEDLIHRLFVCIAGVADQLQTNYAADLRNILKAVFLMNQTPELREEADEPPLPTELEKEHELYEEPRGAPSAGSYDSVYSAEEAFAEDEGGAEARLTRRNTVDVEGLQTAVSPDELCSPERAPDWVPDIAAPDCMRCAAHFTAFRRRHHCRNCGKVFCASCSSNSVPLPRFGQLKPVRVCEECFTGLARQHHSLR